MLRLVLFLHRWLGVPFGAVAVVWFVSGIGMMYWPYPGVTAADRLDRSPSIDASRIRLSPLQAAEKSALVTPAEIRLVVIDQRPAYRFGQDGRGAVVFADTGERFVSPDQTFLDRAAAEWTGRALTDARVETPTDVDQWTIQTFRTSAPLVKYTWPSGDQVYVSRASGQVVQHTTTASRAGAYVGPILHWFYFTPLRRHASVWAQVVIWLSAAAALTALLGLVVGLVRFSPSKKYRLDGLPVRLPYRGQKRWHTVLGLSFGLAALTWAFSGLLSMDPFPNSRQERVEGGDESIRTRVMATLDGHVSPTFAGEDPRRALEKLEGLEVKELEWVELAEPFYLATLAGGATRVVPLDGPSRSQIGEMRIADRVRDAAGPNGVSEIRRLDQYDLYYRDRRRLRPLPVLLVALRDGSATRIYVDPGTARIVGTYSSDDWMNRWAYHALHSLDFPWLYNHRPAWDIVVITFMLGGTALGITSLILGWRVVGRALTRLAA